MDVEVFLKPVITRGKISLPGFPVTKTEVFPGPENVLSDHVKYEADVCYPHTAFGT